MFCNNCGNELKDDSKFCDKCGKPINNAEIDLDLSQFNNNQSKACKYLQETYHLSFMEATRIVAQKAQEQKQLTKNILCCPKCKNTNIDLVSTDKNMKTKQQTSLNLNPLKPFTLFNTKTIQKEKKSASKIGLGILTGGASLLVTGTKNKKHSEYFCRNCGHRWIGK